MHENTNTNNSEETRLLALKRYAILDSRPEPQFDRIVRLATRIFGTPIALISFVDEERLWFKARQGFEVTELPRVASFCDLATELRTMIVPNAQKDERFKDNDLVVGDSLIRFYAGAPLTTPEGLALGTPCVLDTMPRKGFSNEDCQALSDLAALVMDEMDLRHELARRKNASHMLNQARDAIIMRDLNHRITFWNAGAERIYGRTAEEVRGKSVLDMTRGEPAPFLAAFAMLGTQGHWSGRLNHRRKDGAGIIVEAHWTLARDAEGKPQGVVASTPTLLNAWPSRIRCDSHNAWRRSAN